jgi:hypothetical protein
MKQEIKTEIAIESSCERVYEILTNLSSYSAWNPFIVRSEGYAITGKTIKNTMKNGDKEIVFRPKVLKAEQGVAFEWLGSLLFKGLFDGHHYFHIQKIEENKINLIHGEKFSGILSGMILRKIGDQTRGNFIKMNRALKTEAETLNPEI